MQDVCATTYKSVSAAVCSAVLSVPLLFPLLRLLRPFRLLQPFPLRASSRCALLIALVTRTHCARTPRSGRGGRGRGRAREMQTRSPLAAPSRGAARRGAKMMARIRQRVRCSFHRRFAERGCRSLRAAARCAGHASDTGQNSTGPAFEKVNNGKHDILY